MDIKAFTSLILNILKDWRVIAIAVLTIIVIRLAVYVVKYKKRPPRVKKQKPVAAKAEAPKNASNADASKEDSSQEDESSGAQEGGKKK